MELNKQLLSYFTDNRQINKFWLQNEHLYIADPEILLQFLDYNKHVLETNLI